MTDDSFIPSPDCDARTPVLELRRFFREGFTASDVAEALVSWEAATPAAEVAARLDARAFDAAGVRIDGAVAGWVLREELESGRCADHLRSFFDAAVVSARAPLQAVIAALEGSPRVFVTSFGAVGGIITSADLQKAPVRMWLFGLVTLVEETFSRLIREHMPGDAWRPLLSPRRLEIACRLHAERQRRNESLDLVDCLQFGDKGTILTKDEALRRRVGFRSRTRAREVVKHLEALRNRLAHSQDIVDGGLSVIIELARELDRVLDVVAHG